MPLIDLRLICNEEGDCANPIEPSVQGGEKISAVIEKKNFSSTEKAIGRIHKIEGRIYKMAVGLN